MRKLAILLLAIMAIAGTSAARTHRKPIRAKRPAARTTARSPKHTRTRRTTTPAKPRAQSGPSPERYKEIQQTLADKGYYKGEVNGAWGPESTDALRRFQTDQNLKPDGKIGSLSLIAMGLGPKRTASAQVKPEKSEPTSEPPAPLPPPADIGVRQ